MDEITLSRFKTHPNDGVIGVEGGGSHINVTGVLNDSVTPQYLKGYKPENMTGILT